MGEYFVGEIEPWNDEINEITPELLKSRFKTTSSSRMKASRQQNYRKQVIRKLKTEDDGCPLKNDKKN